MNWLVLGILITAAGIVAAFVVQKFRGRKAENRTRALLLVEAKRQPAGWIKIVVTISNEASDELEVRTITLIEPMLGELVMETGGSELLTGREIAVNQRLPPRAEAIEPPSITLELMLDDPMGLMDEIGLTVAVSPLSDQGGNTLLRNRTHV